MTNHNHSLKVAGYTLIETLIALFILTTTLLGFAALTTQSLQTTRTAQHHDLATLQATAMAERIRANPVAIQQNHYLNTSTLPTGPDCTSQTCSPAEMAHFDLREWNLRNATLLPGGEGGINSSSGHYAITLQWQEGSATQQYQLMISP